MRNESKNNEFIFNFFFSSKTKRKHMRVRDDYNLWKNLKHNKNENKNYLNKYLV